MSKKKFLDKALMYQYDKEIASGFKVDCEAFLDEFERSQSFSFTDFQKVWHQQKFSHVFAGQDYALLLRDFCENCFYIVKKYIMFPRTMYTQVGAFYLLYALYYKQPLRAWVKIRITSEEYQKLYELILEMASRLQVECVYIFSKMKSEEAFLYVAQHKPLGPEDRFVKGVEIYINDTFTSSKTQSALLKFQDLYKSTDLFSKLQTTNVEYSELVKKYAAEKCPSLTPFASDVMDEIKSAYDRFQNDGHNSRMETNEHLNQGNVIGNSRSAIKKKAMENKNAVYRAARSVRTALDLNNETDSESSSD